MLPQVRATRLRPLLRQEAEKDVHQWSKKPATQLVGTSGHKVKEASGTPCDLHGRKHKDTLGRLSDDRQGVVLATVGQGRIAGPVWVLPLHCTLRQGFMPKMGIMIIIIITIIIID